MLRKLLEKNNNYCIVGNSPKEAGKAQGKEIDKHSLVIRFNDFSTDKKFQKDYGKKTNIWIRGTNDKLVYTMEQKKKLFSRFDLIILRAKDKRNKEFRDYCAKNNVSYFIFDRNIEIELTKKLKACPSTGLLTLYHVGKIIGKVEPERVFGFSFCRENRTKNAKGRQVHYYNNKDLVNPETKKVEKIKNTFIISKHLWAKEEEFYKNIILRGKF